MAAKYAFVFVSLVLVGCAIATYFTNPRDGSSFAVPIVLGVAAVVVGLIAWQFERLFRPSSRSAQSDDVGDIAMPGHDHHVADTDADD
jgi:hypothetical protein